MTLELINKDWEINIYKVEYNRGVQVETLLVSLITEANHRSQLFIEAYNYVSKHYSKEIQDKVKVEFIEIIE